MAKQLWLSLVILLLCTGSVQTQALAKSTVTRPPAPNWAPEVFHKKIEVIRKTKWLYAWERRGKNWQKVYSFRVSVGAWDTPTPRGKFHIFWREDFAVNSDGTELGHALDFALINEHPLTMSIHGWDWNPFTEKWGWGSHRLGRVRVTQGCVQLLRRDMAKLYRWTPLGTPMIVH